MASLPSFLDNTGRPWTVTFSPSAINDIVCTLGDHPFQAAYGEDGIPLRDMIADTGKFAQVVWSLLRQQADAAGIKEAQLAERLRGRLPKVCTAVRAAAMEAVSKRQRPALRKVFDTSKLFIDIGTLRHG